MKTLIVDDDPNSHKVLQRLLTEIDPSMELLSSAYSVAEGEKIIKNETPELVFLDIELPDGLGFDLLRKLGTVDFHLIFITAHDNYAISAFHFGAIHFLLKPIDKNELINAIHRVRTFQQLKLDRERLELLEETYEKASQKQLPSRLVLMTQNDNIYLKVEDIIRLEASNVYTLFHMRNEPQPFISSNNLGKYAEQFLPYPTFVQIHRSHLINLNFVKRYNKGNRLVLMEDGSEIPVSRRYYDDFQEGMENI